MKTSKTVKHAFELTNLRQIEISFKHTGSAKMIITELKRYSEDTTKRVSFSYCYSTGNILEQAYKLLVSKGWNVVCRSNDYNKYILLCDNFGNDYLEIKNLKN
jgi:hypothetical protein